MTPLVEAEACFALTLTRKELREIIAFSAMLLATLAILAPLAGAQRRGDQITGNGDVVEFRADNIGGGTPDSNCYAASPNACPPNGGAMEGNPRRGQQPPATPGSEPAEASKNQPTDAKLRGSQPADFNRNIYYGNKLEFSLDGGWLPINIPFAFDVFEGDAYDAYPLKYTLVPIIASLRWHMSDIAGPGILRGNWDLTCSGSATLIPRGAETRYFAYIMGIRRNFVPRNWRVAPYFDLRLGLGDINAKGPDGVRYAQGQDFTFTGNLGSGVRYNFNPRYAISAGLNYMHISNAGLSEPQVPNYGINVYGPMFGLDIQLRRRHEPSAQ
ncbi:MAG: acyloxyacyl hydrolase [Candidatus Sulfotelmatobacter sp.]